MKAWKWIGLAGVTGVAAAGAVTARKRRTWRHADPNELRTRLHDRLGQSEAPAETTAPDTTAPDTTSDE